MGCPEMQELLDAYLDGELDLVRSLEVERHLADCSECAAAFAALQSLQTAIQSAPLRYAPPRGLQGRVRKSLRQAAGPGRRAVAVLAASWALLLVAMVILAVGVANWWSRTRADPLTREVAEAHIRSLLAEHRTDVASTDRHTVKPWFTGRLDYAPPVPDLSGDGFELAGGRLDYLADRPVSALVYERRRHAINLFVWPTASAETEPVQEAKKGYTLYHWQHGGMTWWAVSDLNAAELGEFVAGVRERTSAGR